jgi:hypothetical protein
VTTNPEEKMLKSTLRFAFVGATASLLASCASMQPHNAESELTAAGFKVRKPDTQKKREIYDSLPDQRLERSTVNGKSYYVFKDQKAGVAYVGGESERQRYQQICRHDHNQPAPEENMNKATAAKYQKYWGVGATLF